jgi:hypothetical protein
MRPKFFSWVLCMVVMNMFILAGIARADEMVKMCVIDANAEYKECRQYCLENMQADKDSCRNINHACAEACREGFDTCIENPSDALDDCKAVCMSNLNVAKQQCRVNFGAGTGALDTCIDQAQIGAFICRDECRESIHLAAVLKQCRKAERACIKACPPAITQP